MASAGTAGGTLAGYGVSSFSKSLFLGELHEDMVFPYPTLAPDERQRVRRLVTSFREFAAERYDPRRVEEQRWVGDDIIKGLGELGVMGLYIPERYGGQGLSQTGYCRVSEEFGQVDGTLAVVMGVHQSIGTKGIYLYGSDEQKERFLPDLAAGRKLAGFALTEPQAGSDVAGVRSRARRRPDGAWVLNGEKRWIGNGGKDVVVTFARVDSEAEDAGLIALILTRGMEGFEAPERFDTMGLRGNDLRRLEFHDVVVPPENVLGEPGDGFRIAMNVLNNGRMSLACGCAGGVKKLIRMAVEHVLERRQFTLRLADFELVQEKIAWMVAYLYGLEAVCYLTTGLVDRDVPDYSLESAMTKVAATEFLWYAANRVFQLAGGKAYMRDEPYEKVLRDIRVYTIFEGTNDTLRAFITLAGLRPLARDLEGLAHLDLTDPLRATSVLAEYAVDRVRRKLRPPRLGAAHPTLKALADPVGDQVAELRAMGERLLRAHGADIRMRQWQQKRLAHAAMDILAQIATLSRASQAVEERGTEASAEQRYIAETYCTRAARRVRGAFDQVERNDDERMHTIAERAYRSGGYDFPIHPV